MKKQDEQLNLRRLTNRLAYDPNYGELTHILATTFDFNSDFFELDFLPSVLGLRTWDDRSWAGRVALEKKLAHLDAATVFMESSRYTGRPRSLRLELLPVTKSVGGVLHAKTVVLVREKCLQLMVSSANLTEFGYRKNREAAAVFTISEKDYAAVPLVSTALEGMRNALKASWSPSAELAYRAAKHRLSQFPSEIEENNTWFFWGGNEQPLWQYFLDRWPADDSVERISVVSPFWSEQPDHGFIDSFLGHLTSVGQLTSVANLRLYTEAKAVSDTEYQPVLPPAYAAYNFSELGVAAFACMVDPGVLSAEVDGYSGFSGTRPLHAKVLVLEGRNTTLLYMGSANFTRHGWGFGVEPARANIEAGVIALLTGKNRQIAASLLPNCIGAPLPLGSGTATKTSPPEEDTFHQAWPAFIRDARLRESEKDASTLELTFTIAPELCQGTWSAAVPRGDGSNVVLLDADECVTQYRISLSSEILNILMRQQEVIIRWWAYEAGVRIPINVDIAARDTLPIVTGASRPKEGELIAYYQGRIAWEDLFPDPNSTSSENGKGPTDQSDSSVDTSNIQSYRIREFVEAIPGIVSDIKMASGTGRTARFALFGPVSPISIAHEIVTAATNGSRTPTAAGFQLVELIACLRVARAHTVPDDVRKDWETALDEAVSKIEAMLAALRTKYPDLVDGRGAFARYEEAVRRGVLA